MPLPVDIDASPVEGNYKIVVILLEFADVRGVKTPNEIRNFFFGTSAGAADERSVRDFFLETSGGALELGGTVVPMWVRSEHTMAYYGNSPYMAGDFDPLFSVYEPGYTNWWCAMALEAIHLADPYVDFADFVNPDGTVDIVVIHAGTSEDYYIQANVKKFDIWSHMGWVCAEDGQWNVHYFDGVLVDTYMTASEFSPLGTHAHELGHLVLTLPDLYPGGDPVGSWELMAAGAWDGFYASKPRDPHLTYHAGNDPSHLGAWSKAALGWVAPLLVDPAAPPTYYALVPAEKASGLRALRLDVESSACQQTMRLVSPWAWQTVPGDRYFLIEHRSGDAGRYDGANAANGILVWYVDECANGGSWWGANAITGSQRVVLVRDQTQDLNFAAIPAGESFSRLGRWSSTIGDCETSCERTDWFVEVLAANSTAAYVRVGKTQTDLVLHWPARLNVVSHPYVEGGPQGRAYVFPVQGRLESPLARILPRNTAIVFEADGASEYLITLRRDSVDMEGCLEDDPPCDPFGSSGVPLACSGSTLVYCTVPEDAVPGQYRLRIVATPDAGWVGTREVRTQVLLV